MPPQRRPQLSPFNIQHSEYLFVATHVERGLLDSLSSYHIPLSAKASHLSHIQMTDTIRSGLNNVRLGLALGTTITGTNTTLPGNLTIPGSAAIAGSLTAASGSITGTLTTNSIQAASTLTTLAISGPLQFNYLHTGVNLVSATYYRQYFNTAYWDPMRYDGYTTGTSNVANFNTGPLSQTLASATAGNGNPFTANGLPGLYVRNDWATDSIFNKTSSGSNLSDNGSTFYNNDTVPHKYIITNSYCYQNQSTFITACCVFTGGITGSTKLSATANPGNNYQVNYISYVSSFSGASSNACKMTRGNVCCNRETALPFL